LKSAPQNVAGLSDRGVGKAVLPECIRVWNATATEYPREKTVAQLFGEVATARPDSTAVEFGNQRLTYSELNVRSNRIANRLRRMGVGAETMVGCCLERSPEMIAAFIGILKAGGAYVPLDPSYPKKRFDYMLKDTRAPLLLTQKSLASGLHIEDNMRAICVDEFDASDAPDDHVIMPPQSISLEDLGRTIREHGVTTLWLTSGLFNLIVEQRLEDLRPIRQLLAGGDVLSPRHVRLVLENLPDCRLINGYGPTENTTFTCCHTMRHGDRVPESIPIGRPISNTRVYILDEQLNALPPGKIGELYAGGDGVARGYLNDPEATAEKFVPNPFVTRDERMYRTGDLARWCDDGIIEFMGRIDAQVKVLGHRIEPSEVETALRGNKDISQVCVIADSIDGVSKRLVAYYVASTTPGPSPSDLRKFLADKLPDFMIPALFIPLGTLPLSPNGKVDRSALPAPTVASSVESSTDVASTQLEKTLADLWRRILHVDRVGQDDNFFDLGGDSLQIVAVHSNLQKMLQIEIPVTDLFEFTTIRTLARHLGDKKPDAPSFADVRQQAHRQRECFELQKQRREGLLP
jgi:acyl-CoA synthetase (AMP-forming)/AMP-acid ligase II/acyl carrier protein